MTVQLICNRVLSLVCLQAELSWTLLRPSGTGTGSGSGSGSGSGIGIGSGSASGSGSSSSLFTVENRHLIIAKF